MFDAVADAKKKNAALAASRDAARATRGYLVTSAGTGTTHAAIDLTKGHGGYFHPRSLCQPHTVKIYHYEVQDQTADVTCQRCIASLAKVGRRAVA